MFGFSHFPELIVVLIVALVVFGPKRLPELGSSLGKGIREFRQATTELHGGTRGDTSAQLLSEPSADMPHGYAAPAHATPADTATLASGPARNAHERVAV